MTGTVYFVGAGPGAADLITLRGARLLSAADVVVYAGSLVPQEVLSHCRPGATKIDSAWLTLEQILERMIPAANEGKLVVRLHSGDPSIYGAIHEQIVALRNAGVPFEVVPGVSSFQAAAARLHLELTVPDVVQTVILTRVSGATSVPDEEDLERLAAHRASLCIFLSARHVTQAQEKLIPHYGEHAPVAIAHRVGWPDELVRIVELKDLASAVRGMGVTRTVLFVVSPALAAGERARSRLYSADHWHLFRKRTGSRPRAPLPRTDTEPAVGRAVFLLGGTSESRETAAVACALGIPVVASVTTEPARQLYEGLPHVRILVGKLPREALLRAVRNAEAVLILDATHPFAASISQTAIRVARELGIPYLRYERPDVVAGDDHVTIHADVDALIRSGVLRGRRVLLTVGTKALGTFACHCGDAVLYVRVLDSPEAQAKAVAAGFPADRVIAMPVPVPEADERRLWTRLEIEAVVAKASGVPGGEDVKRRVAAALGVDLHLIARPRIDYPAVVRTEQELMERLARLREVPCAT